MLATGTFGPTHLREKPWGRGCARGSPRMDLCFRAEKRSAQASAHPLSQAQGGLFCVLKCVDCTVCLFVTETVLTKTEWNAQGVNVCSSKSLFTFVWFLFFVTYKLFWTRTTNVKGKTNHPVSLRWNKKFSTFPKRRVFFWLCFRFIGELISPSFAGLN